MINCLLKSVCYIGLKLIKYPINFLLNITILKNTSTLTNSAYFKLSYYEGKECDYNLAYELVTWSFQWGLKWIYISSTPMIHSIILQ